MDALIQWALFFDAEGTKYRSLSLSPNEWFLVFLTDSTNQIIKINSTYGETLTGKQFPTGLHMIQTEINSNSQNILVWGFDTLNGVAVWGELSNLGTPLNLYRPAGLNFDGYWAFYASYIHEYDYVI